MIIRATCATNKPFIISAANSSEKFTHEDVDEEAKALAYLLYSRLPGPTMRKLKEHLNTISDHSNTLNRTLFQEECSRFAIEREIK